ncbi:MAG: ribosome hibernation-promoting factor, HPF/YfiA family [Holosporales bacterium]|jgi:ribosomal subunit interface protein
MKINISGRHMNIGASLTSHIQETLQHAATKYLNRITDATVVVDHQGYRFHTHISVNPGTKTALTIQAEYESDDPYASFDGAAAKLVKQLRRYKRRLTDHHLNALDAIEKHTVAREYVVSAQTDEEGAEKDNEQTPLVIAEMSSDIKTISVKDAVMLLDLSGRPVYIFKNAKTNNLNVVFRRPDGNVGWIEPQNKVS